MHENVLGSCDHAMTEIAATLLNTVLTPVALPPGRLTLATRPRLTGSPAMAKTMGMVVLAALAASTAAGPPTATMTAGLAASQLRCERRQSIVCSSAQE